MMIKTLNEYKENGLLVSQNHPTLPLSIWNYTPKVQYEGLWDEITTICRGLVIHNETGEIISRGFPKFWNLEENRHTPTNAFEIFEKLDGQYIGCFWYNGEMIVNSRGSFDSIYSREAKRILHEKYRFFTGCFPKNYTACFELVGFEQIVVSYPTPDLIATGLFDSYGFELSLSYRSNLYGIPIVKKFDGLDYKNIKQLNWQNAEGFVVRFNNGHRCKIKFEDYIKLHRQMTNLSTTGIWEALKENKPVSEILNDVPDEFYDKVQEYENTLREKYAEIVEMSTLYFNFFKPKLYSRKLFFDSINTFVAEPYKFVVLNMIDDKDSSEIIWNYLRPAFAKI